MLLLPTKVSRFKVKIQSQGQCRRLCTDHIAFHEVLTVQIMNKINVTPLIKEFKSVNMYYLSSGIMTGR